MVADDRRDALVVEVVLHDRADLVDALQAGVQPARGPEVHDVRRPRGREQRRDRHRRADLAHPGDEDGQAVVVELPRLLLERHHQQGPVLTHLAGEPHDPAPPRSGSSCSRSTMRGVTLCTTQPTTTPVPLAAQCSAAGGKRLPV